MIAVSDLLTQAFNAPLIMWSKALLVPQLHTIQLCLNQLSLPEAPFGLNNPQNASMQRLITGLSESIVSAKSLVSVLLHTPPGQEVYFSNIFWVMLHCGFTLAARLDILAADPRIGFMGQHLRQFSDIGHTIRQVVLRLESATSPDLDERGDRDSFYHFVIRTRRVEDWYLRQQRQCASQQQEMQQSLNMATTTASFPSLGTPTSDLSNQASNLNYTVAPTLFSQAVAPGSGDFAYPNYTVPEPSTGMASNTEYAMDTLSFLPDTFIPFRSWDHIIGNEDSGGVHF